MKFIDEIYSEVAKHINKSQGMALSAAANITAADNTISTSLQAGNPRESIQNRDFNCLH